MKVQGNLRVHVPDWHIVHDPYPIYDGAWPSPKGFQGWSNTSFAQVIGSEQGRNDVYSNRGIVKGCDCSPFYETWNGQGGGAKLNYFR